VLLQSYDKWQRELYSVGEPLEDFAMAARQLLSENTKNDEGMISNPHSRLHESRFEYKKWEAVELRKKNPPVLSEEMRQRIEANRQKALEMKRKRASAEMDADAAAIAELEAAAAGMSPTGVVPAAPMLVPMLTEASQPMSAQPLPRSAAGVPVAAVPLARGPGRPPASSEVVQPVFDAPLQSALSQGNYKKLDVNLNWVKCPQDAGAVMSMLSAGLIDMAFMFTEDAVAFAAQNHLRICGTFSTTPRRIRRRRGWSCGGT